MKFIPVIVKLLLVASVHFIIVDVHAQYYDSLNLVNANWKIEKLARGVKLYTMHFNGKNLFRSNQYISFIEIKRKRKNEFDIAADSTKLINTSEFAKNHHALAAINGNFFNVTKGGSVAFVKKDGKIINDPPMNSRPSNNQRAAIVIDNGVPSIKKWDGFISWKNDLKGDDIMLTGPLLIFDRIYNPLDSTGFTKNRHPRSCVGITKKGRTILLVADGRNTQAYGLSLYELANIMKWLGCENAVNLDGGGSSTLWAKGQGIINHPSDNKKFDHEGERPVANIIYIKRKK
ncbi:MAG: phosphodiester glycosidase family protein [Niabella sp.]